MRAVQVVLLRVRWPRVLARLAALFAACLVSVAHADEPIVFAAASLKNALDDINAQWLRESGTSAKIVYAASSALAKQIDAGAPADVFISADLDWMDWADQHRRIRPGTRANLLGNRIVLIAPADAAVSIAIAPNFPLAHALGDGRLAMADTQAVPAGKYGKAALEALGVWPSVAGRIAQAENVRAALALVARGEAPLGIVYATDAAAEPKVKVVGTFAQDTHPPIVYPIGVVATSHNDHAAAFVAYLRSAPARAVFEKQGFTVLR